MPVLDHPVHARTIEKEGAVNGCWNKVRPTVGESGYWAPDRKYYPDGRFEVVCKWVPFVMTEDCMYDKSMSDPKCLDCKHRGTGEKYWLEVTLKGK